MNDYFIIFDLLGTVSFAVNGFFAAIKKKLDYLGALIICGATALGGGVLRDLLTGNPVYIFHNSHPLMVVIGVFCLMLVCFQYFYQSNLKAFPYLKKLYQISDSIGLVFFAQAGSIVAINADFHFLGIVIISLLSATGGSLMRDVMLNEIPSLFKGEYYGTVAMMLGALIYWEHTYWVIDELTILLNMLLGLSLRFVIVRYNLQAPKIGG